MGEIFLQGLKINNVRHLHDIDIPLSYEERKHLILTGKNGSGKTSVLETIKAYFEGLEENQIHLEYWKKRLDVYMSAEREPNETLMLQEYDYMKRPIAQRYTYREAIEKYSKISIQFSEQSNLYYSLRSNEYMFVYFPAKRDVKYREVSGPQKLDFQKVPQLYNNFSPSFLQYLVNQKTELSFAQVDKDQSQSKSIEKWFDDFENILQQMYGQNVKLEFDRKEWNFYLLLDGHERFDLNHLSDGYAAIMNIISELLLRINANYQFRGVVLIDEIETHLHIELQRKILPLLTTFFPQIQFIVTTHSPFVLSSVNNAIIYDLEKRERVEDMSGYSAESIIESYFDVDQYSDLVKRKVKEYEELSQKAELTVEESNRFRELEKYFNKFPLSLAPELSLKINNIRLKKIA
jgi:predicted ATP-binding protein involved in virulence